jgi:hypothetical protein
MSASVQNAIVLLSTYVTPSRFHSRHCSTLAEQLEAVAPSDLTADQRAALAQIIDLGNQVDDISKARQRVSPAAVRAPRLLTCTAWSSLHGSLVALATCPPDLGPEGPAAAELVATLFPDGVTFMQADASAVRSGSKVLLERIEEEALGARIDALVSPQLRRQVGRAHAQLSTALGIDARSSTAPTTSVRSLPEATARFAFAVSAYARALSIGVQPDDELALARFAAALAPIDALRVTGKVDEDEDEGPTPVPPIPGDPTPSPYPGA